MKITTMVAILIALFSMNGHAQEVAALLSCSSFDQEQLTEVRVYENFDGSFRADLFVRNNFGNSLNQTPSKSYDGLFQWNHIFHSTDGASFFLRIAGRPQHLDLDDEDIHLDMVCGNRTKVE